MKTSWLALGVSAASLALIVIACGGADSSSSDVLGQPAPVQNNATASSSGASGNASSGAASSSTSSSGATTSSSSSSASSSGIVCAPCLPPPAGCTPNNAVPCDCSFTCAPDSGSIACTWAQPDPCPTGTYCNATTCTTGTCVAKSVVETVTDDPQCGCDGITYFNSTVAAKRGMPIKRSGQCADGVQVVCGGVLASECPSGVSCNREVKNKAFCASVDVQGQCWQMPAGCAPTAGGNDVRARACSTSACADVCTAIRSQNAWYEDGSCSP